MNRVPPIAGLLILAVSVGLSAQKNSKPPKNPPPPAAGKAAAGNAKNPAPAGEGRGGARGGSAPRINTPLNPVQRFLNMTPEEQQRVLEKAPPQQRVRLQEALDRWNARPEAQKQFAYRQYQSLMKLPPEKQTLLQRQMNALNKLPDDRKKPVRQELIRLLRLTPDQRQARFSSSEFSQHYSPEEQQILKDVSTTLPDDYPLAGR
ncbi:MAG TPA: DUF3106 domain-containing protein [Bryobacteraceae bacterium]|nr:DUF3106 domain-containing protein [Bryobacteraceae bacterium]